MENYIYTLHMKYIIQMNNSLFEVTIFSWGFHGTQLSILWFHHACLGLWIHDCDNEFHENSGLMACIGGKGPCVALGKCPDAWSWSWHLWPTVVEWHRWDIFIYMDWVCLEGSWQGMTLLRHGNIELIMVHHMSKLKPTPRGRDWILNYAY